jgi:hypothetical protein
VAQYRSSFSTVGREFRKACELMQIRMRPCYPKRHRRPLVNDLELFHAELRAALMLAGKQIVKLSFGKKDDPLLPILRRVLREARAVAKRQGITVRIQLAPKEK